MDEGKKKPNRYVERKERMKCENGKMRKDRQNRRDSKRKLCAT